MRILFTAQGEHWEDPVEPRFGRAELMVLYDEADETLHTVSNAETEGMDHGAGLQTAKKVLDLAPDVIITGNGPGNKALDILKRSKIAMYVGANGMTLKEAYDAFRAGELTQFQQ